MSTEDELAAICSDLRAVIERLDSLAFDALREASAAGARERPAIDKRLTRARNALERTLHQLERGGETGLGDAAHGEPGFDHTE